MNFRNILNRIKEIDDLLDFESSPDLGGRSAMDSGPRTADERLPLEDEDVLSMIEGTPPDLSRPDCEFALQECERNCIEQFTNCSLSLPAMVDEVSEAMWMKSCMIDFDTCRTSCEKAHEQCISSSEVTEDQIVTEEPEPIEEVMEEEDEDLDFDPFLDEEEEDDQLL